MSCPPLQLRGQVGRVIRVEQKHIGVYNLDQIGQCCKQPFCVKAACLDLLNVRDGLLGIVFLFDQRHDNAIRLIHQGGGVGVDCVFACQ